MFKKILLFLFLIAFLFLGTEIINQNSVSAEVKNNPNQKNQEIQEQHFFYYFYDEACPFCQKVEENFFPGLKKRNPDLEIRKISPRASLENLKLFRKIAVENFGLDPTKIGVPAMFIGRYYMIGMPNPEEEKKIENIVQHCLTYGCPSPQNITPEQAKDIRKIDYLTLPIIGEIRLADYSFPAITIMIAAADGFNPCALWVLMFLLLLVLKEPSRKRLALIVGTFILVSGIFYFFLLAAWLHLFLLIGHIRTMQLIIAVAALTVGLWQIKNFFTLKAGVCKISQKKGKIYNIITERIKKVVTERGLFLTIIGVAGLAIMVNFFEFICSAGFPAIWSGLLGLQGFPAVYNYLFILLYVVVFMIDELIIFTIAFITLKVTKISHKITTWTTLICGLLMIILGLILLFKPGWLIFM
jgi:glutaredoxin